jgi:hypothetical protein
MLSHLRDHLANGSHSPGILIVRGGQSMRAVIESMELIAYAGRNAEFENTLTYIP